MALVDWDRDGDLDMWILNRSGPQVRYLRNDCPQNHNYVSLKLRGTQCHRDAIGARVEVRIKEDGQHSNDVGLVTTAKDVGDHNSPLSAPGYPPGVALVKTLRAGEVFLGQSSKWLHFGLAYGQAVDVTVRWPDGQIDLFQDLDANRRYHIEQGGGLPVPDDGRRPTCVLESTTFRSPAPDGQARIVLYQRAPLPYLLFVDGQGQRRSLDTFRRRPLLALFWSADCVSCLRDLRNLAENEHQVQAAGVNVVGLCVDRAAEPSASAEGWQRIVDEMHFPYTAGSATDKLLEYLDQLQHALHAGPTPLATPTSFLIDGDGKVAVVYRGRVDLDQVLEDLSLLDAEEDELRHLAVPFRGRWEPRTEFETR